LVAQLRPLQPPQSKEARSGRQMPQALVRTVILGGGVAGLPAANPALQGRRPLQAPPAPPLKPVLHLCHSFRCLSHLMHAAFTVQRFSSTASSTHMTYSHLFCDSSGAARNGEHRPCTGFNSGKLHRRHQPVDSGQPQRHRPGKPRVPRAHPVATQMESPPRVAWRPNLPTHTPPHSLPWTHGTTRYTTVAASTAICLGPIPGDTETAPVSVSSPRPPSPRASVADWRAFIALMVNKTRFFVAAFPDFSARWVGGHRYEAK